MKHLIIIGAGDGARQATDWAKGSYGYGVDWDLKGYIDGDITSPPEMQKKLELPILGDVSSYNIEKDDVFVCAIGTPKVRKRVIEKFLSKGANFMSVISKSAYLGGDFGVGSVIGPQCFIDVSVILHDHVFLNARTIIGHDTEVGAYSFFALNATVTSHCKIGECVSVYAGCVIIPQMIIEDGAVIGAGGIVVKNVEQDSIVFGNPARIKTTKQPGEFNLSLFNGM